MSKLVPLDEVQGIILRGYDKLEAARFVLLKVTDPAAARRWLGELAGDLTSAKNKPEKRAVNVAFTWSGLVKLGVPDEHSRDFSPGFAHEFVEGMDTPHRQRVLGDTDTHTPDTWDWGGQKDYENFHLLLMVYADAQANLDALFGDQEARYRAAGLVEHPKGRFDPLHLKDRKEHFGFRDGIAQPFVEGVLKEAPTKEREEPVQGNALPAGEFLLGYPNAYGVLPPSPTLPAAGGGAAFDFGAHGSYLVVRQLEQNVRAFWTFMKEATARPRSDETPQWLAARMVGRWPNGTPLALSPNKEDPLQLDEDRYNYAEKDPLGLITPLGSHTRRSNPRDSLEPGPGGEGRLTAAASLNVTKLHRIIRRGRPYGPPVAESMQVTDILKQLETPDPVPAVKRGLMFLCFCANIARQFEFVQQTWINNPKFGGLYADPDPLLGHRHTEEMEEAPDDFTVQATPVRRRYQKLPDFVTTRGGAYLFMPGLAAVRYLAALKPPAGASSDGR